jgi:hypothetical protein
MNWMIGGGHVAVLLVCLALAGCGGVIGSDPPDGGPAPDGPGVTDGHADGAGLTDGGGGAVCGNGTVEAGEQCESPFDACCDPATCQLETAGTECRASTGPCDPAEACTGASTTCPVDQTDPTCQNAEWVQLLHDSMAVQDVTQRFTSGDDYGRIISADGRPLPFPDSYAGVVSFAGMQAMLDGRPTGDPDTNIQFFTQGVNTQGVWAWFGARQGHTATQSRIRVSSMFLGVLSESTAQWQLVFKGARGSGARWEGTTGAGGWGIGEDLSTDPNATYVQPYGFYNHELWPHPTVSNPDGVVDFFGTIDRSIIADMRSWVLGVKVRVEGSDRADARFIGTIGIDHYRDDHAGRRYWPSGYPKYVSDSGGAEWKNIRSDGQDQWIVAIGCWEIGRVSTQRPPWGNYDGVWPYAAYPDYGPSWAEIQANPPPDYRNY